jgi:hypothetical protein
LNFFFKEDWSVVIGGGAVIIVVRDMMAGFAANPTYQ